MLADERAAPGTHAASIRLSRCTMLRPLPRLSRDALPDVEFTRRKSVPRPEAAGSLRRVGATSECAQYMADCQR